MILRNGSVQVQFAMPVVNVQADTHEQDLVRLASLISIDHDIVRRIMQPT